MITPYLYEIINKKKSTNRKTQLEIGINFSNLTDKKKNHTSYVTSENIEILPSHDYCFKSSRNQSSSGKNI